MRIRVFRPGRRRGGCTAVMAVFALSVGTVVTGLAVTAEPASASLAGAVLAAPVTSNYDSVQSKTATVTCPAGTTVVGPGGDIFNGGGKVALEQLLPDVSAGTVQVTAKETDAKAGDWSVTARSVCAPAPAGLVRVGVTSVSNSSNKAVTVNCPTNKTALGIGYDVFNGWGEVLVNQVVPNGGPGVASTSVTISAYEDDAYAASWQLKGYLVCADPIAGQQVIRGTVLSTSAGPAAVNATCPTGQTATGGSASIAPVTSGMEGEYAVDSVLPFDLTAGTSVPDNVQAIAYQEDPYPDS